MNGQHILILGLGASGLAMARWCARHGAIVTVADTRAEPPQRAVLSAEWPQVTFVAGPLSAQLLEGRELAAVFKSPGLSPAQVADVAQAAQARGLRVGGELDLFAQGLAQLQASQGYAPKVLAITGTNGKTTVTSLTGLLVERAGLSVAVAGNIGPTLLDTLAARLDTSTLPEVWVLELSSFQLDGVSTFEPTAATVLNLTQDHLDWHGDMPAYAAAKARIFGQQGLPVLNRDDALVTRLLDATAPEAEPGRKPRPGRAAKAGRTFASFGLGLPQRPGDWGLETVNGVSWLVRAHEADETRKRRSRSDAAADEEPLLLQRLMPADALRIRGRHNASNALAALALATAAGAALAPMLYGLREYQGEPHRVESVAIIDDVEYIDDSKGTNVGATVAALQGLGHDRSLVVILGGDGKGQDFAPLLPPLASCGRAVVLIGRDAEVIRRALTDCPVPVLMADTLPQAVMLARQQAHAGDAVLLSPACASLDMFQNYSHRAQVFRSAVADLAAHSGLDLGVSA